MKKRLRGGIPCSSYIQRNAVRRNSLCGGLIAQITKKQEAHGVLLNKHYEIPFEKEYAMGFPLSYSVKPATGCIDSQVTTYG